MPGKIDIGAALRAGGSEERARKSRKLAAGQVASGAVSVPAGPVAAGGMGGPPIGATQFGATPDVPLGRAAVEDVAQMARARSGAAELAGKTAAGATEEIPTGAAPAAAPPGAISLEAELGPIAPAKYATTKGGWRPTTKQERTEREEYDPELQKLQMMDWEKRERYLQSALGHRLEAQDRAIEAAAHHEKVKGTIEHEGLQKQEQLWKGYEQRRDQTVAAIEKLEADISTRKVDPKKIWDDHTGLLMGIAAFLYGFAGRDPMKFVAEVRQRVDREIAVQEKDIERLRGQKGEALTLLGTLRQVFWDDPLKAREVARQLKLQAAETELARAMEGAKSAEVKAHGMEALAGLSAERSTNLDKLLERDKTQVVEAAGERYQPGGRVQVGGGLTLEQQLKLKYFFPKYYEGLAEQAASGRAVAGPNLEGMIELRKAIKSENLPELKMAIDGLNTARERMRAEGTEPTMAAAKLYDIPIVGPTLLEKAPFVTPAMMAYYQARLMVREMFAKRTGGKTITVNEIKLTKDWTEAAGTTEQDDRGREMLTGIVNRAIESVTAAHRADPVARATILEPLLIEMPYLRHKTPETFERTE